jgi:hypothetical protein
MKLKKVKWSHYFMILLCIVYIIALNLPRLSRVTFLLKHLSLYLLSALISYKLIEYYSIKLMKQTEQNNFKNMIRLMKLVVFGSVLFLVATLQTHYIERKESLIPTGCQYYDLNNHMIYQSMYSGDCPKLQISEKSDHKLKYSVLETKKDYFEQYTISHDWYNSLEGSEYQSDTVMRYLENVELDFKLRTDVEIEYDDKKRISRVLLKSSELIEIDDGKNLVYYYRSYYRKINHQYNAESFESIVEIGDFSDRQYKPVDTEVMHHPFSEQEIKTKRLYTVLEDDIHLKIYKETMGDELESHLLASSIISYTEDSIVIVTDLKDELYGIKSNNSLSIGDDERRFDLYEKVGSKTINTNHTSWERFREFDFVVKEKSSNNLTKKVMNYDYERYYDRVRDSVIIDGINIYELKQKPHYNLLTFYRESNDPLFGKKEQRQTVYYDLLYHPTQL